MIEILQKGMLTTVQDGGRRGSRQSGVPVCGAMDMHALRLANILAGNDWEEAALEITGLGPSLRFVEANIFAIAGADFGPMLDGVAIKTNRAYLATKGSVLTFGAAKGGFRACIAFCGGLDIPLVLGSRSTCLTAGFGGLEGRALRAGDRIGFRAARTFLPGMSLRAARYDMPRETALRVIPGPQSDSFSEKGKRSFFSGTYQITPESNRMGYRTKGPVIEFAEGKGPNIISDGIAPGAIQVPGGQPIILMADRQTVGGYAKIGHVISADLPIIAQLRPGDSISFRETDVDTAQTILRDTARRLRNLEVEMNYSYSAY